MDSVFLSNGTTCTIETRPGVFAQYGIDYGSRLLLKLVDIPTTGTFLDLGSGCGILGIAIAKLRKDAKVYLVDTDIRAVRLSEANAKINNVSNINVILSDVVEDIPNDLEFDLVVSNPPTHQGRKVLRSFIAGAYSVMSKGASAYFVVNRMTSTMKDLQKYFGQVNKIKRKKGYIVYRCIK